MYARHVATVALFGVVLLSGGQSALARPAGAHGFMSRPFVPHAFFHQRFPFRLQHFGPRTTGFAWPIAPFTDWAPIQSPTAEPAAPEVIVMPVPEVPVPQQTAPAAPLDFSYVAGCHAIPNGYHCDTAANASDVKPRKTQMNTD